MFNFSKKSHYSYFLLLSVKENELYSLKWAADLCCDCLILFIHQVLVWSGSEPRSLPWTVVLPLLCVFSFFFSTHGCTFGRAEKWVKGCAAASVSCTICWRHEGFNKSSCYLHSTGWHPILWLPSHRPFTQIPPLPAHPSWLWGLFAFFFTICTLTQREAASSGTRSPDVQSCIR